MKYKMLGGKKKFVFIGDTIILKNVFIPSFKNFDKLLQKTQQFAKEKNITNVDLEGTINRTRK